MHEPIRQLRVRQYTIPPDAPESDGTLEWNQTTIVIVELEAGGHTGIGYTYGNVAVADVIGRDLNEVVLNQNAMDVPSIWSAAVRRVRNVGRPGIASMAISAVDTAAWDLKARILGVPLASLFGRVRRSVPVYGSGGFTSYSLRRLEEQLSSWVSQGIRCVKMKVERNPEQDVSRVKAARAAIGPEVELFVDANGAYSRKLALKHAEAFARQDVRWFEEPVSSDDLEGLRLVRDRAPVQMDIAAGEYGYTAQYFRRMLEAGAVDVLQADATRCAGFTGFLQAAALCEAYNVPLSAHTAPALHAAVGCACGALKNIEYFHDHVRIESMFFEGVPELDDGNLVPNMSSAGMGLKLKHRELEKYAA